MPRSHVRVTHFIKKFLWIHIASMQFSLRRAIRLAKLARANITVSTKLDQLSLAASNVQLANLFVESIAQLVVLDSDGKKMLLKVKADPPIARKLASELVVIEMNFL